MKDHLPYIIGFTQTDGHLESKSKNGNIVGKGRLTYNLAYKDRDILPKIGDILGAHFSLSTKVSDTNFKKNYKHAKLSVYDKNVRQIIFESGVPHGKKSNIISVPDGLEYNVDYWRGMIDGDGSLGLTNQRIPFVSFCTSSKTICLAYQEFLTSLLGKTKIVSPNKRDGCYNICVWREDAQIVASNLYYDGCLSLNRKNRQAQKVISWIRPLNMKKKPPGKWWDKEQDKILLSNTNDIQVAEMLGRTKQSVCMRRWRLSRIK